MSATMTLTPGKQLWGIYHTDREYASTLGDPLRTTVEAPTKIAAEEAAAKLGFSAPWAHPIAPDVARLTQSIVKKHSTHRQELVHKSSRHSHLIMQAPSTAQIRTAIEVLKQLGERINTHAGDSVMQLSESHHDAHYAGRIEVGAIEQTTRIEAVAAQLKQWRDELIQDRRQCVSHHV